MLEINQDRSQKGDGASGRLRRKSMAQGSYTVEASLVVPMIFLVMATLIYMIFYLHDQYIISVYANRMAQECCWLYVENEHARSKQSSSQIIGQVSEKYDKELQGQMLMTRITKSLGTCKKNLLSHVYTATWRVTGEPETFIDLSVFHFFDTVIGEGSYERIHIRQWILANDLVKGGDHKNAGIED